MNPKIMARMAGIEIREKPHYNVVFATPGNAMSAGYVDSLVKTLHWLGKQGLSYTLLNNYSSFVSSAREMTATDSDGQDWSAVELGEESSPMTRCSGLTLTSLGRLSSSGRCFIATKI